MEGQIKRWQSREERDLKGGGRRLEIKEIQYILLSQRHKITLGSASMMVSDAGLQEG